MAKFVKTNQLFRDISEQTFLKINQVDNVNEFDIRKIKKGILSIHAEWSGYSLMYGNVILKFIDDSESDDFEINIIDIDSLTPEKQIELFGAVCHGYFESFWIENGKTKFIYRDNGNASEITKFKEFLNRKISNQLIN